MTPGKHHRSNSAVRVWPIPDHFDGKRFFNPTLPKGYTPTFRSVIDVASVAWRKSNRGKNQSAKPRDGPYQRRDGSAPACQVAIDPCPTPARLAVTMPESKSINASRAPICRRHPNVRASIQREVLAGRSTVCQTASRPAQPRECQVPELRTSAQSCSLQYR